MSVVEDDEDLAEVFRSESASIVNELGRALLAVESEGPAGPAQEEAFRHFHTLKGMANMAGLTHVADLCHEAEAALAPGQQPPVDFLFFRLDEVARLLRGEDSPAVGEAEATEDRFVSVDVTRLDALLNLVGELTVAETRIVYESRTRPDGPAEESLRRLSHLVRSVHEEVMRARLLPMRTLFSRLPRLARDAAKAHGKDVRVVVDESHLELDRAVVDRVGGALAHLIQNAVVHGIETPEERTRAGKPAQGLVRVSARREHEFAVVEVSDDGRGIHAERVRSRAVERGMLSREEAEALKDEDVVALLLTPSFSTADSADRHAGRGVGLTAARDVARALGGSIAIDSRAGRGMRVAMRLPPSVAVLDTLLAESAGATVALPLRDVVRIVAAEHSRSVGGTPSVLHAGQPVPLLSVGGDGLQQPPGDGFVVVGRSTRGVFGLHVERLLGTHSAILKPVDATLTPEVHALGATVLGNGQLAIVLDLDAYQGTVMTE